MVNMALFGDPCGYEEFLRITYQCIPGECVEICSEEALETLHCVKPSPGQCYINLVFTYLLIWICEFTLIVTVVSYRGLLRRGEGRGGETAIDDYKRNLPIEKMVVVKTLDGSGLNFANASTRDILWRHLGVKSLSRLDAANIKVRQR